jgi:hypothetical protein
MGAVSSATGTISDAVAEAIEGQREAASANVQRLESQFGRESDYLLKNLMNQRTSLLEGTRGGAVSGAALNMVDKEIEKSMRDLEQRKEEMILAGNAAAATAISDLQMKQLEMKVNVQQQKFTNALGLGQFGMQVQELINSQRANLQRQTMEQLQYNLNVQAQEDFRAKTVMEQIESTARIGIMKQELAIKQAIEARAARIESIQPSPGFVSFMEQVRFNGEIAPMLYKISSDKTMTDSEAWAAREQVYAYAKNAFSGSATEEAIDKYFFGESFDSAKAKYEAEERALLIQPTMFDNMMSGLQGLFAPMLPSEPVNYASGTKSSYDSMFNYTNQ